MAGLIHLDTNWLIRCLVKESAEAAAVLAWLRAEEPLACSSVCWYEFESGSPDPELRHVVLSVLSGGIEPWDRDCADMAARLWAGAGRLRRLRVDAMIAAQAIRAGARLATNNRADFEAFVPMGLALL
jgi:predicted nucleic acid-binding protein